MKRKHIERAKICNYSGCGRGVHEAQEKNSGNSSGPLYLNAVEGYVKIEQKFYPVLTVKVKFQNGPVSGFFRRLDLVIKKRGRGRTRGYLVNWIASTNY